MAITGELWTGLYTGDATRIRKWLYGSVLIRDWAADGSTALTNFTPFETDGSITSTLLSASNPGGRWYELGALTEAGVELNPKFTVDETKIWQSRRSQRTDITEDDEDVMFTCVESTPIIDALRYNLPISSVVDGVGATPYSVAKPNTTDTIYRQILVIGVDGPQTDAEYICEVRPRVSLNKVGKRAFAAKSVDSTELTYGVYPDPASGFAASTIRSGPAWTQAGGPVVWPTPQVAPVVSGLLSGGKATITLAQPVSPNQPFTYVVKTSADTGTTWVAATLDTTFNAVGYQTVGSTVTLKVSGVAAGSKLVQVIATASDAAVGTSSSSTAATFLA